MKYKHLLVGIAMSAPVAFASAAVITSSSALVFFTTDGILNADFGHTFGAVDKGKSFLDEYTFTITAADVGASFSSPATFRGSSAVSDLSFTAFDLYSSSGIKLATGDLESGMIRGADAGAVMSSLGVGSYKLAIAGTVLGSSGGRYIGAVTVSPVPEPETWGMTLSGLAAVGMLARRRQSMGAKAG